MSTTTPTIKTTAADFCETRQNAECQQTFERPLDNGSRLEVTVKSEGQTMFQPPSGWTLTADDIVETRCLSQSQSMRFPCDADTTRRLEQLRYVVDGRNPLPWTRRLMRWLRRK